MASFTDDGLHWNKTNLHFNELGLPYTVPPWDQTFPQNSFKKYNWDEICQMSGLELIQHFTVRFNPVIWRSRSNLRQVTYRCNLVSACRREFSGFIGVQKMIRHIKRHLAKLEEHRVMNSCCKQYIENLTFYAVGDKFPTGIVTANDCQTATNPEIITLKSLGNHESKMKNCEKIWDNKKIETEASENVLRTQNIASNSNDTLVQSKCCKEENNNLITSGEENLDSKEIVPDLSYSCYFTSTSAATSSSTVSWVGFHSKSSSISNSSFTKPLTSRVRRDDNLMTKEKDCGIVGEVTKKSKRAGVLDSTAYFLPATNASLKGISDLCKKLKAEEAQLAVVYKEETTPLKLDENCEVKDESYLKPESGIYSHTSQPSYDKNTRETECLVDSRISCHSLTGNDPISLNMTQVAIKSVTISPQDTCENTCNESILEVDCEKSGFLPGISSSDAELPFTAEASSEVSSSNITNQNLQVSQSKYGELLAVIEEIGKDIRPTYAGSKNASERLKKGIMHARALVRECLIETERCARQ